MGSSPSLLFEVLEVEQWLLSASIVVREVGR